MKAQRRSILKQLFASVASMTGLGASTKAIAEPAPDKEMIGMDSPGRNDGPVDSPGRDAGPVDSPGVDSQQDVPLYSGHTKLGNLVFISGAGAHFDGDTKAHTDHVLKELEKELIKAGSSMEKVLKVSVFLHDLNDYKGMNEVYKGRFGPKPPVRTTVAVHAGVPGKSWVEIDCIAYI